MQRLCTTTIVAGLSKNKTLFVHGAQDGSSSSKDTKHVIQLAIILQILFHAIDKVLGIILCVPLSLRITKENVHQAIAVNEYTVDIKGILKNVSGIEAFY